MKCCSIFIVLICLLTSSRLLSANKVESIESHIIMGDFHTALRICQKALDEDFDNTRLQKLHIKILANMDLDFEALQCWKTYFLDKEVSDYELIETLGWSVLNSSTQKKSPYLHAALLSGTFVIDDIRAVKMVIKHLDSPNSFIRAMALQLSVRYRDEIIIEKIRNMIAKEKVCFVKLEAIKALGMMQAGGSRAYLKKIITDDKALDEEKEAAVISLVSGYGFVSHNEILQLLHSNRSGLRCLGCNIIGFIDKQDGEKDLYPLLKDLSPDVRMAALNNLYLLGISSLSPDSIAHIAMLCEDSNPRVSILASWILAPYFIEKSTAKLQFWLQSSRQNIRCMAAYFLAKIGKQEKENIVLVLKNSMDPFVRLNMALGMLGSEIDDQLALDEIAFFLKNNQKKIMNFTPPFSLFSLVLSSKVKHSPQMPRYPNMVDNMARLDLLKILASLQYMGAKDSIRKIFKK